VGPYRFAMSGALFIKLLREKTDDKGNL